MPAKKRWSLGYPSALTAFAGEKDRFHLESLLGLKGEPGFSYPETQGIVHVTSSLAPQGHRFGLRKATKRGNLLRLELSAPEGLALRSDWEHDPATGVLRRRDTLTNRGRKSVTLSRALPRFTFARGLYAAYAQSSGWGSESQGSWRDLGRGVSMEWESERGRLCQTAAPYLCVKRKDAVAGLALQVVTRGNWIIRLRAADASFTPQGPHAVLEAGLCDRHLALPLKPGESLELPELILQPLPDGLPESGAEPLHRHLLARDLKDQPRRPPLLFNTWFDRYDDLDPQRLLAQARVAKSLGCEVFVVDAGWFGKAGLAYDKQVGHWEEKPDAAFRGRMLDFSRQIRAMGLGFGVWMEPERLARQAPLVKEHPDWVIETTPGMEYRLDMEHPKARAWIKAQIKRVVETYKVVWLKVDSNFGPGLDARGRELEGYFSSWWTLLDELKAEHPGTFFEACSSGSMRSELSALTHHSGIFLSDNVNPRLLLRYLQGTALRLPPSRHTLWTVLKGDGKGGVVGPKVHSLGDPLPLDPSFIAAACLAGTLTFSGDFLALPESAKAALRHWAAFWKARREFITSSSCHLLTPIQPLEDMQGWTALQLQAPKDPRRLVLAFRMDEAAASQLIRLQGLDPRGRYALSRSEVGKLEGRDLGVKSGAELMKRGLLLKLPTRFSSQVLELTLLGKKKRRS